MRWLRIIIPMLLLCFASCQRRPFAEDRSKVYLDLRLNLEIVNHEVEELPQNMRVDLYDPETGNIMYTDYVGPKGGYIHPMPGTYNLVVYNIGTESTIVHNEHDYNKIEAYTNEISSFLKSQMREFLAKRYKLSKGGDPVDKAPQPNLDELVVNEPDHIFVGWHNNLEVPVTYEYEDFKEVYVEVEAHTIVQTWQVEIRNVEGAQWIGSTVAIMSGQKASVHIGPNIHSDTVAGVYFEMALEDNETGGKCLKGKFNTFGIHPVNVVGASLDLGVRDRAGQDFMFQYDVTDQFEDNEQRYIVIEEPLVIEEPKVEGGGFQPVVDDWDEIVTDIEL